MLEEASPNRGGRMELRVTRRDVGSVFDELLHHVQLTRSGGCVQRRDAVRGNGDASPEQAADQVPTGVPRRDPHELARAGLAHVTDLVDQRQVPAKGSLRPRRDAEWVLPAPEVAEDADL